MKELRKGDTHGDTTILGYSHSDNGVVYDALCKCGVTFKIRGSRYRSAKRNNKNIGCGCLRGKGNKGNYSNHRLYPTYKAMIARCYNKKNAGYPNYGGRGIKVCSRWLESFDNFLEDMGGSYEEGLSIDRINNEKGYHPNNCRWANIYEQAWNKRSTLNSLGIGKIEGYDRWKVSRSVFGRKIYLGSFLDFFEACCVSLSFKNKVVNGEVTKDNLSDYHIKVSARNKSGKNGVSWDKSRGKWKAHARKDNTVYNLGRYTLKEDAIMARKKWEKEHLTNE